MKFAIMPKNPQWMASGCGNMANIMAGRMQYAPTQRQNVS
jgi:hypothetical protein